MNFLSLARALTLAALLTGSVGALAPAAVAVAQHEEAHGEAGAEHGDGGHGDAGHGDAGHGDAGHGEHAAPEVNWFTWEAGLPPPMLASLLNFGIWLGLLVFLGRKPLASFLANRRRGIEDGLDEARRLEDAAQKKYDEYSERIENLDSEVEKLRADFAQKAVTLFGSGWAWLTVVDGKLTLEQTRNADLPKGKALLVIDVWEHAYYVDFRNARAIETGEGGDEAVEFPVEMNIAKNFRAVRLEGGAEIPEVHA